MDAKHAASESSSHSLGLHASSTDTELYHRHPSIFMTWANARDVDLMDDVTDALQEQAHRLAAHGASPAELQKVKKVGAEAQAS